MTDQETRKRSRNYTSSEIELLFELAGKKKKILNGRLSSNVTAQKKKTIWAEISREINGVNGQNDRTPAELKKKWQNMSTAARSKERLNKESKRKTGGGPSEEVPLTTIEQMALDNTSSVQIEGIGGGFESNRNVMQSSEESSIMDLQPNAEDVTSPGRNSDNLVETIGEGLRAIYGSVQVRAGEDDYHLYSPIYASDNDDAPTLPPDSPNNTYHSIDIFEREQLAVPTTQNQFADSLVVAGTPLIQTVAASAPTVSETQVDEAVLAHGPAQHTTPGPIRSNRTVTRDLRRQEFKEILQRKDKLNELLSNTNSILTQILEELKKRT